MMEDEVFLPAITIGVLVGVVIAGLVFGFVQNNELDAFCQKRGYQDGEFTSNQTGVIRCYGKIEIKPEPEPEFEEYY